LALKRLEEHRILYYGNHNYKTKVGYSRQQLAMKRLEERRYLNLWKSQLCYSVF